MSTRLLSRPGSRHTITDDLESHYFVLVWTALHWVQHNRPGYPDIDMEYIFDQQRPVGDKIVMGGAGKVDMYGSQEALCNVEFACKPFNELFWDLWRLFARYLSERRETSWKKGPSPGKWFQ